jgi:hypothetical protein
MSLKRQHVKVVRNWYEVRCRRAVSCDQAHFYLAKAQKTDATASKILQPQAKVNKRENTHKYTNV